MSDVSKYNKSAIVKSAIVACPRKKNQPRPNGDYPGGHSKISHQRSKIAATIYRYTTAKLPVPLTKSAITKSEISHSSLPLNKPPFMHFRLFIATCLFFVHSLNAQKTGADTKMVTAFDDYIKQVLPAWQTPGISVVVVKDGRIVFKKAYGLREL